MAREARRNWAKWLVEEAGISERQLNAWASRATRAKPTVVEIEDPDGTTVHWIAVRVDGTCYRTRNPDEIVTKNEVELHQWQIDEMEKAAKAADIAERRYRAELSKVRREEMRSRRSAWFSWQSMARPTRGERDY